MYYQLKFLKRVYMNVRISGKTAYVFDYMAYVTENKYYLDEYKLSKRLRIYSNATEDKFYPLESLQSLLADFEQYITNESHEWSECERNKFYNFFPLKIKQDFGEITKENLDWLICEEEIEIIPIYDEAIAVVAYRNIIDIQKIPNTLSFLNIPGDKHNGIVGENHNFGFHFHCGVVKSSRLERTNIIFTFDPSISIESQERSLFSETHAEGKNNKFEVDLIGINRRLPIYTVCCNKAKKIGFNNFKKVGNNSKIFFSDTCGTN